MFDTSKVLENCSLQTCPKHVYNYFPGFAGLFGMFSPFQNMVWYWFGKLGIGMQLSHICQGIKYYDMDG